MDKGFTLEHLAHLVGFAFLIGLAAWHRVRLDNEIVELGEDVHARLGWSHDGQGSARAHRRRIASRLVLRGLPAWLPLSDAGWRHLLWLRVMALASIFYVIVVIPGSAGAWTLVPIIGLPSVTILAIRAWHVGPWGRA